MSLVRKNTTANFLGQVWTGVVGLIFVPVYIRCMGVEAYGIIGFFVVLQSLFAILDLGLSATLNRELAVRSVNNSAAQSTRDLMRTLEWIFGCSAAFIVLGVWLLSYPLAAHWLNPGQLTTDQTAQALLLLGMAAAIQWPVSLYTGGLSGLQQQVQLNFLAATFATIRAVGAALILLYVSPTIEAFLWWQIFVGLFHTAFFARAVWGRLPVGDRRSSFSAHEIRGIRSFAGGIAGTAIVVFLLTQTDRIVLSRLLPLAEFGAYVLAASVAAMLLRFVHPISNAVSPQFNRLVAAGDSEQLIRFYHHTNQIVASVVLPIAAVLAVFSIDILRVWTSDPALSAAAGPALAILVVGTALNGLMTLPYAMQLAFAWTRLGFWMNVASLIFVVPAVWFLGVKYGGIGAAMAWLLLNLAYVTIAIPLMHRRILQHEMRRWYLIDILPALLASALVAVAWRLVVPVIPGGLSGVALLALIATTTLAAAVATSAGPRRMVIGWMMHR